MKMKHSWLNSVFPIAALFSFRMLGLFMLIPVFTLYATELTSATPTLIGIALGSYGLSQGVLQIPFGLLSDRFGRKPLITIGLILFALGSLWGALTTSIYGMIFARTLQGTGAIGSVLIALLADLTTDAQRTKAMAVIGMTIGLSFSLALVISPTITHWFGLAGIFYLTTFLALLGLLLLHSVIPTPPKEPFQIEAHKHHVTRFKQALCHPQLQRLDIGIFCQHAILTSTFFVIPMILQQQISLGRISQSWHFYLPLMLFAFITMLPILILAEKKNHLKAVFLASIALTGLCQLTLFFASNQWMALCAALFAYFVGFNILEASLPSLVSKHAEAHTKGTAMGIYSSSQFLGIFAGGLLAGVTYQATGTQGIFILNTAVALIWWLLSRGIQPTNYEITLRFTYNPMSSDVDSLINQLKHLKGVNHVAVHTEQKCLCLRVNKSLYQPGEAERILFTHPSRKSP